MRDDLQRIAPRPIPGKTYILLLYMLEGGQGLELLRNDLLTFPDLET